VDAKLDSKHCALAVSNNLLGL